MRPPRPTERLPHRRRAVRPLAATAAIGLLAVTGVAQAGGSSPAADQADRPHLLIQAHRGYSEVYPENTLAAMRAAFDAGADRVEGDLALTADGHVVYMHDRTVDRTTDGSGRVASMTLEEIKTLDAGSWKDPRFAGEPVPTLSEALDLADGRGELNLELKTNALTLLQIVDLVEATLAVIDAHDARDRVVVSSFDMRALQMVEERDPEVRILVIDWSSGGTGSGVEVAIARGWYGAALNRQYMTEEQVRRAAEAGLFTHAGAGRGAPLDTWVSWGLQGVSNDDPAMLHAWLTELGYRPDDP